MLGQMVELYFKQSGYDVVSIEEKFKERFSDRFISIVQKAGAGFIINCIGKIPQKNQNNESFYELNARLPLHLLNGQLKSQFLVHPSTDCIFNGSGGNAYPAGSIPDAVDDYGKSKILAEKHLSHARRAIIFRASIVGPDVKSKSGTGLMGWFLSQHKGEMVNGYTNHHWNGVTTLEWCQQVESFIKNFKSESAACNLVQLGTRETYTKYQVLCLFKKIFHTQVHIEPIKNLVSINRSLQPDIYCQSLERQLIELKTFLQHKELSAVI